MATYNKIADWVNNEGEVADLDNDTFAVALSNTAPGSESTPPTGDGNGVLANVTQVSYTYCSTRTLTLASSAQTGGTYKIDFNDLVLTASGDVGPFRYVYIYDDTPATTVIDPLVCYFDYGESITLHNGETLTITINANGLYTKT
jgi:hypothetical protein